MSVINDSKLQNLVPDDDVIINKHVDKQKWAVISFISPNDLIKKKFVFDSARFLYHDINKQLVDMSTHLVSFINNEFSKLIDSKINELTEKKDKILVESLKDIKNNLKLDEEYENSMVLRQYKLDENDISDRFESYCLTNHKNLEQEFSKNNNNQTSLRGVKIRGSFETLEEARNRANYVRNNIEQHIHAYVIPVGVWVPWDPNPDVAQDQEYMLDELNNLMGQYKENVESVKEVFDRRKTELIDKTNEENNKRIKENIVNRIADINSNENVANENIANENIANENVANENVANENVANEKVANEKVANENKKKKKKKKKNKKKN